MTWKERRLITVLSVILAILSAALLIVLGIRYRQSRDAVQDPAAQAVQAAQAAGSTYASLSVYSGSATLSFSIQEDGTWVWDDDTEFPLDDSTIESMMDLLSDLTPQQVLSDPESLESYELDAPSASISAVKVDQSTVSVTFGKATTDGTSRYAMMNDDASTIYIFADTLYQALQTPIYDMMTLPELPELPESSISSISIQGPGEDAQPLLLAAQHTDDGATTWLSGGEDVTDNASVQALLEDLAQMQIARCVDYRPSDEAASICGFDAPDALVQVTYTPEDGSESIWTLTVGTTEPGGTGRYARIGADTTIYLLETALLDPLMRIAAGGLTS